MGNQNSRLVEDKDMSDFARECLPIAQPQISFNNFLKVCIWYFKGQEASTSVRNTTIRVTVELKDSYAELTLLLKLKDLSGQYSAQMLNSDEIQCWIEKLVPALLADVSHHEFSMASMKASFCDKLSRQINERVHTDLVCSIAITELNSIQYKLANTRQNEGCVNDSDVTTVMQTGTLENQVGGIVASELVKGVEQLRIVDDQLSSNQDKSSTAQNVMAQSKLYSTTSQNILRSDPKSPRQSSSSTTNLTSTGSALPAQSLANSPSCSSQSNRKYTAQDFEVVDKLGDGSFSEVLRVRLKKNGQEFALKAMDKEYLMRHNVAKYVRAEKGVLQHLISPGIVGLHFTFQDEQHVYLGLELAPNGELLSQIQACVKGLPHAHIVQYMSETICILEALRSVGVIHRDIKPENLMLTSDGHLKLIDFGTTKVTDDAKQSLKDACAMPNISAAQKSNSSLAGRHSIQQKRSTSFVGTADYIPPEVLNNQPISYSVDIWGAGCLLYQMYMGVPPFRASTEYLTYQNISKGLPEELSDCIPPVAASLVQGMLNENPEDRLGASDINDLKQHEYFKDVDWNTIYSVKGPEFKVIPRRHVDRESLQWQIQSFKGLTLAKNNAGSAQA